MSVPDGSLVLIKTNHPFTENFYFNNFAIPVNGVCGGAAAGIAASQFWDPRFNWLHSLRLLSVCSFCAHHPPVHVGFLFPPTSQKKKPDTLPLGCVKVRVHVALHWTEPSVPSRVYPCLVPIVSRIGYIFTATLSRISVY